MIGGCGFEGQSSKQSAALRPLAGGVGSACIAFKSTVLPVGAITMQVTTSMPPKVHILIVVACLSVTVTVTGFGLGLGLVHGSLTQFCLACY